MTGFQGIHHVGVVVESIEASVAWYVEYLGFERLYALGLPGVRAAMIGREGMVIEFLNEPDAEPMAVERWNLGANLRIGGISHFAIAVSDLDTALSDLQAKGIMMVSPAREVPNSGGSRFAYLHDNEQMLVELFQPAT